MWDSSSRSLQVDWQTYFLSEIISPRQTGSGRYDASRPLGPPTESGTAPPWYLGGVAMTERAERLAGLVGGEALVAEPELLVPELEDFADGAVAHVAVGVVGPVLLGGVAPEESAPRELPVGGEVRVGHGKRLALGRELGEAAPRREERQ